MGAVAVVVYLAIASAVGWFYGRLNWYREEEGYAARSPRGEEIISIGFQSFFWPLTLPFLFAINSAHAGVRRQKEVRSAQYQLAEEIRQAMPEVEKLLGEALTPEIGIWIKDVKKLANTGSR